MSNQIVLRADASQIKTFIRCPQRWFYEYKMSIKPRGYKASKPLDKGTLLHALLDIYYNNWHIIGQTAAANLAIRKAKTVTQLTPEEIKFCQDRFIQYVGYWKFANQEFIPAAVEVGFSKIIHDSPLFLFILEGRIDLIVENDKEKIFVDHKSQSRVYDHYKFDPQFCSYALALGSSRGIINYIGTQDKVTENTFRRTPLFFSTQQIKIWEEELIDWFRQMAMMLMANKYQKRRTSCKEGTQECLYTTICEQPNNNLTQIMIKSHYEEVEPWQPWKIPEEEEKNGNKILKITHT